MSDPIKPGDLVMCVAACCDVMRNKHLGKIRQVVRLAVHGGTRCPHCGLKDEGVHALSATSKYGSPIWWLKRIDPLAENDDVEHDEQITA